MNLRLKFILGTLVVVAGFLFMRAAVLLDHSINTARTQANILSAANSAFATEDPLTKDSDRDGLSDRDEIIYGTDPFNPDTDGDTYKDGEEIISGTDPLNPSDSPPHKTGSISSLSPIANMTDRLLNLGIAGLVDDAGQLDPNQMSTKKFADIMTNINSAASLTLAGPPIADQDINLSTDNSGTAAKKYLDTLSTVLGKTFSSGANQLGVPSDPDFYLNQYHALKILPVPGSWKEIHKTVLGNFRQLANAFKAMTDLEDDPVKASFGLEQIQSSFLSLIDTFTAASQLAQQQNLYSANATP